MRMWSPTETKCSRPICKVILQESYHSAPEEVRTMGKMFKEMFEEVGFRCKLTNVGTDESGDMLTGILGEDRPGKPIIFGGHMDTVHKLGSFPCKFEVDDEGKVPWPRRSGHEGRYRDRSVCLQGTQ